MDRNTLTRHVRDALTHFYEPAFLQTSPLARLVAAEAADECLATALRSILREAIELLRPSASVPYGRPDWIGYRLLWAHFIQRQSPHIVGEELHLSRSSFYRHQQQALKAVADIIWNRYLREADATATRPQREGLSLDEQAVQQAVELAQRSPRQMLSPSALLREMRAILRPLLVERDSELTLDVSSSLPPIFGDPAILHQIVVDIVTTTLDHLGKGALCLSVRLENGELGFRLSWQSARGVGDWEPGPHEMVLARELLKVYRGRLCLKSGAAAAPHIAFMLPASKPFSILVADDDADTAVLYRRYLQDHGYSVRVARDGAELSKTLDEDRPDLIILDVLMPLEDGWTILQRLKALPETADIPIIVYSVLNQPSLALALGAAEVLRKPVQEQELVGAIRRALAPPRHGG